MLEPEKSGERLKHKKNQRLKTSILLKYFKTRETLGES
jgi:hypothetical protein